MAKLKTTQNNLSVAKFVNGVADKKKRQDCVTLLELMKQVTRAEPKMWGSSIVGFGSHHYVYESGREGDTFLAGFSPRKQDLTLYNMGGLEQHGELWTKLGKYKTGKSCLYVKSLEDVHLPTLKKLIRHSVRQMAKTSA